MSREKHRSSFPSGTYELPTVALKASTDTGVYVKRGIPPFRRRWYVEDKRYVLAGMYIEFTLTRIVCSNPNARSTDEHCSARRIKVLVLNI